MMKKNLNKFADIALIIAVVGCLTTNGYAKQIPFVLPWDDMSETVTSAASLNTPITDAERIGIDANGHFVAADKRVRFVGMNMTFMAPFPPRDMAESVAGRMAKFGINAVRFHHIDNSWNSLGLIDYKKDGSSRNISKKGLEEMQFFVSQLKQKGVYTDLNLLISRSFSDKDGFPVQINEMGWKDQHLLGFFNDHALQLQKDYASGVLTPKSPFTGLSFAEDPAVAFVEIINENGIIQGWKSGSLDGMPVVFQKQLQKRWNRWLQEKYSGTAELKKAWNFREQPLGDNLLKNSDFKSLNDGEENLSPWRLEQHSGRGKLSIDSVEFPVHEGQMNKTKALKLEILNPGDVSWHIQLNQAGLSWKKGDITTLSFWAKSDHPLQLSASIMQSVNPFQVLQGRSEELTTEWKKFTYTFIADGDEPSLRCNFGGFADSVGKVWLANVEYRTGGSVGNLDSVSSLTQGTIPNVSWKDPSTYEARKNWLEFLRSLEVEYYDAMVSHIKEACGYKGLVFGTILANSPASVQATMDVIDSHGYWNHPEFPGAAWDGNNWIVNNISMTGVIENTFTGCALQHVLGKPFVCTEYQHPSPNYYSAEGPLIMGSYASLQDWDGYWFFDYGTGNGTIDMGYFRDFFDTGAHPTKMANLMMSAWLFRRGDVSVSKEEVIVPVSRKSELEHLCKSGAWNLTSLRQYGVKGKVVYNKRVSIELNENDAKAGEIVQMAIESVPENNIVSDTGELIWGLDNQNVMKINTPKTRALVGFTDNKKTQLGSISIEPGKTMLGWSSIIITTLEGDSLDNFSKALLVATGQTDNTNMQWKNERKNSVGSNWGKSPVLTEVVPFKLSLPYKASEVQVYALDTKGARMKEISLKDLDEKALLETNDDCETIWYEIVRK